MSSIAKDLSGGNINKNGLRRKIFLSHLTVALVSFVILAGALSSTIWLSEQSRVLVSAANPNKQLILRDIHESVEKASSRVYQYIAVPNNETKHRWKNIWNKEIWPLIDELEHTTPKDTSLEPQLLALKEFSTRLEVTHWQIIDVSGSEGGLPAEYIMNNHAPPIESNINSVLNSLIELEAHHPNAAFRTLDMKLLADLRAAFVRTATGAHRFVHHAEPAIEASIISGKNDIQSYISKIMRNNALMPEEAALLKWLQQEVGFYFRLVDKASDIRKSDHWNISQHMIINRMQPISETVEYIISGIYDYLAEKIETSSENIFATTEISLMLSVLLLSAMIIVAYFTARFRANRLMAPIENLVVAAKKLSNEETGTPLPVNSDDELGTLTEAFNHMQESLLKKRNELLQLASTDPLTQLANRRKFTEVIEKEWKRCQRDKKEIAVVLMDVDHFKLYNDQFGHQAGDAALITLADIIRDTLHRPSDLAARYGGEEFIIVLPETCLEGAYQIASRIHKKIRQAPLPLANNAQITISCGVACCSSKQDYDWERLVKLSDEALYQAKSDGRDCIRIASCEAVDDIEAIL